MRIIFIGGTHIERIERWEFYCHSCLRYVISPFLVEYGNVRQLIEGFLLSMDVGELKVA